MVRHSKQLSTIWCKSVYWKDEIVILHTVEMPSAQKFLQHMCTQLCLLSNHPTKLCHKTENDYLPKIFTIWCQLSWTLFSNAMAVVLNVNRNSVLSAQWLVFGIRFKWDPEQKLPTNWLNGIPIFCFSAHNNTALIYCCCWLLQPSVKSSKLSPNIAEKRL